MAVPMVGRCVFCNGPATLADPFDDVCRDCWSKRVLQLDNEKKGVVNGDKNK